MKYALLISEDETLWDTWSKDRIGEMLGRYRDFSERHADVITGGAALQPTATATTVRVRNGERMLTDGPFAETREQFGGLYIVDVPGLDEALELAAELPGAETGGVEVRLVVTFSDDGQPS